MKDNFCTLFNFAYLSRGLVLYESLCKHSPNFHLYVFAFDTETKIYFELAKLPHLTVISLEEFENEALLKVKPLRTAGEYCWTCTSSSILYCLQSFHLASCTYLDADMCFYADPRILIEEMGDCSVLITDHRYSPAYDQSRTCGKYCVQFVTFCNDQQGLAVLNSWRDSCIDWCYARMEDGKFGDQKYLDEWPDRFPKVHELQHLGGGLAPWNVQQYTFQKTSSGITAKELMTGKNFQVVFFHFHGMKFFTDNMVLYTIDSYKLSSQVKELFYKPYIRELTKAKTESAVFISSGDSHGAIGKAPSKVDFFVNLVRFYYNLFKSGSFFGQKSIYRRLYYHYHVINP